MLFRPGWILMLGLLFAHALTHPIPVGALESAYTSLENCPIVEEDEESGSIVERCPGIGGYQLLVLSDDARSTITVVSPRGRELPLDLWSVVTGHFSQLGKRAEWRIERQGTRVVPRALIVRVDAFENLDEPRRATSYLAVAKIREGQACVTARIPPGPGQNAEARAAADSAHDRPCLERRSE